MKRASFYTWEPWGIGPGDHYTLSLAGVFVGLYVHRAGSSYFITRDPVGMGPALSRYFGSLGEAQDFAIGIDRTSKELAARANLQRR